MDVRRLLVVPQAQIHGMPEVAVSRPLGKPDLRHEHRPHPVRPLVRLRPFAERTCLRLERFQLCHDAGELGLVEAGADVADIHERTIVVDAQRQRAEMGACVPRLGPAADDELLLVDDFQLAPVGRSLARPVARDRRASRSGPPTRSRAPAAYNARPSPRTLSLTRSNGDRVRPRSLFEHGAALGQRPIAIVGRARRAGRRRRSARSAREAPRRPPALER